MNLPIHIVAAGAFIENGHKILLLKNEKRGWEIPGGQIEMGEDLIDGIVREIKEEANIEVEIEKLIGIYSNLKYGYNKQFKRDIPSKVIIDFIGRWKNGEIRESNEHIGIKWIEKEEGIELIESSIMKRRYRNYLDYKGKKKYMSYRTDPYEEIKIMEV